LPGGALQNGDTCVLISIIVSGSEVDGVYVGGGGFRLLKGSHCHVVVIYIMPYVMLDIIHPSQGKINKAFETSSL
jgi:hypothetical protein